MRLEFARPWVRFPAGLRCVFSSADPAVSSSIFVGAEREENLIRNDPDKSEFTGDRKMLHCLYVYWSGLGENKKEDEVGKW